MDAQGAAITGDADWTNPRWNYPEYPRGSVVELRVHGVGGEGPSGMTRDPNPRNVGGDALAGFWRARNPVVGRTPGGLHVREVLAWGGQTSGTTRHAFWVLLLPFALFNVAGRMHPSNARGRRAAAHRAVARLLAYTMTLGVVALSCALAFDLFGRQYGLSGGIGRSRGALSAPLEFFDGPADRMGFVALVPVAVLLVLWTAGRYRTRSLEGNPVYGSNLAEPVALDDVNFWRGEWPASRLRAAHATGGLAFVAATLALVLGDIGPHDQRGVWNAALVAASAVVALCGLVVTLPHTVRPGPSTTLSHAQWILRFVALATLVPSIVVALGSRIPNPPEGIAGSMVIAGTAAVTYWILSVARGASAYRPSTTIRGNLIVAVGLATIVTALPSIARSFAAGASFSTELGALPESMAWLPAALADRLTALVPHLYVPAYALLWPVIAIQGLLLLALLATGVERRPPAREGADSAGLGFPLNAGGVVVALLALLLITAAGASIHTLAIEALGARSSSPVTGMVLPWWYSFAALVAAFGLPALIALALVGCLAARRFVGSMRAAPPTIRDVAGDLDRGSGAPVPPVPSIEAGLKALGRTWMRQRLLRDAAAILTVAVLLAAIGVVGFFLLVGLHPEISITREFPLTSAAVWALTATAGVVVGLIRSSLNDKHRQRQVAILWDVLSFWPRVTHPFAPPCYGEAVVPMLDVRAREWRDRGYRVVLAGHSQGSVVLLATVVLGTGRAHLVTYGSPIVILYERCFPGVFGGPDGAIAKAERAALSWHHLYGMSEPFAMPFWSVPGASESARRSGWQASALVPHADEPCPVCGWRRAGPLGPGGAATCTDFVVSDPGRWRVPLDPVDEPFEGHSAYHDNREVDEHIARIVARARV